MSDINIELKVDVSGLTFGDLEKIDSASAGSMPMRDVIPLLDKMVVGGVRHLPITAMPAILKAVEAAMKDIGNPETPQGN
jgi:hypothetical protein